MTLLEFLALIVVVLLIVLSFTAPPWVVAGPRPRRRGRPTARTETNGY